MGKTHPNKTFLPDRYRCGGTILTNRLQNYINNNSKPLQSQRHILTAAFCVLDQIMDNKVLKPEHVKVLLTDQVNKNTDIVVKEILVHPEYFETGTKDAAILTLQNPLAHHEVLLFEPKLKIFISLVNYFV